ncbi:phosphatase PAP2 family protein [Candidatus Saccharibacteria bacterium]|nr:phosphatase PAP2 family protein [Candidatus Saccharibacteria bacterium]
MNWNLITNIIIVLAIVILGLFVLLGLFQWYKRKSLKKVDKELLYLPLPFALLGIVYLVFEKFIILNTRPNGSGEPSFPSTHTMVAATIFFLAIIILPKYIKNQKLVLILDAIMIVLTILIAIGRVLANMHWVVDVIGGLAFALIFTWVYYYALNRKTQP